MQGKIPEKSVASERLWSLRRPVQYLADITVLASALLLAYLPAVNIRLDSFYLNTAIIQLPLVVFIQFSCLFLFGGYSIIWRYVSISDVSLFVKAAALSGLILVILRFFAANLIAPEWQVPLSVILIDTGLGFSGLLGVRVLRRVVYEIGEKRNFRGLKHIPLRKIPTLFVGAGRIASVAVREVAARPNSGVDVKGFVDDDKVKLGGSVHGIKVLGTTEDLPRLVSEFSIEQIVIAVDDAKGSDIRRILELCRFLPVKTRIVPSIGEIVQGKVSVSRIRDVEIEDILRRDPVELDDRNLNEFLENKVVLVTGAGGSIGGELAKQVTRFNPKSVLLVERAEYLLFQIERELASDFTETHFVPLIADVCDAQRMREIFAIFKPDVVLHAAAHKHVPLMETNPAEAIKNNVFGTQMLAEISGESGVSDFVLVSTDKAVNPTSVMGASKRLAEIVIQESNRIFSTNYIAVRFGNVLGSAGSVVPIFREQIRKGEAISVTHPEMTRYFMTIPEASQLVLQAGALGTGGEIFILDMGEPVKILDLAEDMIKLSGLQPYEDIDIIFSGVRPGEKLFEELEISGENLLKTRHPKIFIGKIATYEAGDVSNMISNFRQAVSDADETKIRTLINHFLPEATVSASQAAEDGSPTALEEDDARHTTNPGLIESKS